jgi:hypothetical protein
MGCGMSNHITLKLQLHGRTALSLLVSKHGDPNKAVWLRKSKIIGERAVDGTTVELTMPETLARGERLT